MNSVAKKFYKVTLLFIAAIILMLVSAPVFAAECGGVETSLIECESSGGGAIREVLAKIINIITIGVGVLGVIGVSVAGIQYLTAGGSEEKTRKAKTRINEIIIGLGIYAVLWAGINWLLPGGASFGKVDAEKIAFTNQKTSFTVGDSTTMRAAMYPLDASDTITYSSSNPNVATVDSTGRVVARSSGTTTITAESSSGKTATTTITVSQPVSNTTPSGGSSSGSSGSSSSSSGIRNGLTRAQAQKLADYYNSDAVNICSISRYCNKNDCSAFVAWFLTNFTDIQPGTVEGPATFWVMGYNYGNNLVGVPMQSNNPGAYSVVSTTGGGNFRGSYNHVELIVAMDGGNSMTVAAATGGWRNRSDGPAIVQNDALPSGLSYNDISGHVDYNKLASIVGN